MDGKTLVNQLYKTIQEDSTSSYIDLRTSYDRIYEAACELVRITRALTSSQSITTVATTSSYTISSDYMYMYMMNDFNEYVIKYSDGSATYWPTFREAQYIKYGDNTTSQNIPDNFGITDATETAVLTSTATADGAATFGQCTLTDSTASFLTTVAVGDMVHNSTDGSDGVVLSITSNTAIVTALFGGTADDWTTSDVYAIVPQGRKSMLLDPPSLTSGHTITFDYIQKPDPVYSEIGRYRFNPIYTPALVKYAAWLYKYSDGQPNFGDRWYQYWQQNVRASLSQENKAMNRYSFKTNYQKKSMRDRSWR